MLYKGIIKVCFSLGEGMMNTFRWAFIGSGNIAKTVGREITKSGRHKIVSVYSPNKKHRESFAKRFGATSSNSIEEAVNRPDVDAVYIASVHTSHKEEGLEVLNLKKPVLIEKPMGISLSEVEDLVGASKKANVYLVEAMWTWFSPVAINVKKWIQDGLIGDILSISGEFSIPKFFFTKNSRVVNPMTAGGALLDIGIYPITYTYNIFGTPKQIHCVGKLAKGIDIHDEIILQYPNYEAHIACFSDTTIQDKYEIVGTKGKITIPFAHSASKAILKRGDLKMIYHGKTSYLQEFDLVREEISSGLKESLYVPFSSTIECMKIMDKCRRDMKLVYPFEKR